MRVWIVMLVIALLSGCGVYDTLNEGFSHSQEVAADLEGDVGVKPFVGFNWSNGSLANITINFQEVPEGYSVKQIAALARKSIHLRFKQEPEQIVISYVLPGGEA